MCGRYVTPDEAALERFWELLRVNPLAEPYRQSFNVAPTQRVPAVRVREGVREAVLLRWGLIPHFARGVAGKYSTINARAETITTSPAYRTAWRRGQRCLLLASGFYEWQDRGPAGRQPFYIQCADQPVFCFAGLWDASTTAEGETIESCTIITLPASPMMREIHNTKFREPAIARTEALETWLAGTPAEAMAMLTAYPDDLRTAWPVSTRVNRPAVNEPGLIEAMR